MHVLSHDTFCKYLLGLNFTIGATRFYGEEAEQGFGTISSLRQTTMRMTATGREERITEFVHSINSRKFDCLPTSLLRRWTRFSKEIVGLETAFRDDIRRVAIPYLQANALGAPPWPGPVTSFLAAIHEEIRQFARDSQAARRKRLDLEGDFVSTADSWQTAADHFAFLTSRASEANAIADDCHVRWLDAINFLQKFDETAVKNKLGALIGKIAAAPSGLLIKEQLSSASSFEQKMAIALDFSRRHVFVDKLGLLRKTLSSLHLQVQATRIRLKKVSETAEVNKLKLRLSKTIRSIESAVLKYNRVMIMGHASEALSASDVCEGPPTRWEVFGSDMSFAAQSDLVEKWIKWARTKQELKELLEDAVALRDYYRSHRSLVVAAIAAHDVVISNAHTLSASASPPYAAAPAPAAVPAPAPQLIDPVLSPLMSEASSASPTIAEDVDRWKQLHAFHFPPSWTCPPGLYICTAQQDPNYSRGCKFLLSEELSRVLALSCRLDITIAIMKGEREPTESDLQQPEAEVSTTPDEDGDGGDGQGSDDVDTPADTDEPQPEVEEQQL